MQRRAWLSLGLLAVGVGLLLTAQLAGAARGLRQGGIFRYGIESASVQVDPQLAYTSTAWWLEYATAAKLFNYPDRRGQEGALLRPEVVSRYRVSRDGRTWTFFLRRGFRFSDGSAVTARHFVYAIDRVANQDLGSPAAPFITDSRGTNILGAREVNEGNVRHVSGVTGRGYRLTIRLTRPSSSLPTILAMPFFQATSTALPLNREVRTGYPSAGPYFFKRHVPDDKTELRRNRHYGGSRPHHLAGVDVIWNIDRSAFPPQPVYDGQGAPPGEANGLVKRFGVNRTRFWVEPTLCVGFVPLNSNRPLFRKNPSLRRAVSWAIDRRAHLALAPPYSGTPWTHLLPALFPGSVTAEALQPYAPTANLARARRLARGHFRDGRVTIGYSSSSRLQNADAQLLRQELIRLGFEPQKITLKPVSGADLYDAMGKTNADLDMRASSAWCSDYPDSYRFARSILASTLDSPRYEAKLAATAALPGKARRKALGRLDLEIMRSVAPVVATRTYNNLYVFSVRVDPKSLVYSGAYSGFGIPALALK